MYLKKKKYLTRYQIRADSSIKKTLKPLLLYLCFNKTSTYPTGDEFCSCLKASVKSYLPILDFSRFLRWIISLLLFLSRSQEKKPPSSPNIGVNILLGEDHHLLWCNWGVVEGEAKISLNGKITVHAVSM